MEKLLIPNPSTHDVVSFNILVNDAEINPSYQVLSISIIKEVNRISLAKIILRDGDAALRNFEVSDTDDFLPGKKIKIKLGFDSTNAQQFKGVITKHAIKIKESGAAELQIDCSDEAVKMTIGRHSHYFENVKDSQVFDELIGKYAGLQSDPESTSITHKELVQHSMSDWDFMLLRAEANGMLVHTNDGNIKINKPDTSTAPVLQVTYGSSIIEFEAEMDAKYQWKNVEATSWDYANQNLFTAEANEASSFTQHGNVSSSTLADTINLNKYLLQHSGHLQEQELKTWVDGVMLRSRLAKIRGRARVTGFAGIKTGDMLTLAGVGNRFNGNAYVTAVTQSVADGTWYTHIQFGLDPKRFSNIHPDADDLLSAGLLSAIHGLQIGKVVQLQNDPDGEDRILVKIPVIDNNAEGIWIRVASLDAGQNRGAFFMPEIDDEVIVGFINADPRHAVMLGMLHSSAKPAPLSLNDDNHEKGIFTRSNMRIHFNDDTKTITIDTPAGNSIKLDEQGTMIEIKDQNDNKVTMNSSGITLDSPLNVEIKAGVNLTLSAGASLTIGAVSLSVKADGTLALEGAMSNLKASGITEITGSLVKIN
jgi:Rhs element Vgr protein